MLCRDSDKKIHEHDHQNPLNAERLNHFTNAELSSPRSYARNIALCLGYMLGNLYSDCGLKTPRQLCDYMRQAR